MAYTFDPSKYPREVKGGLAQSQQPPPPKRTWPARWQEYVSLASHAHHRKDRHLLSDNRHELPGIVALTPSHRVS